MVTEPEAIRAVLVDDTFTTERIGRETGPLSQWLYSGLAEAGLPIICVETRHMPAALSAQLNKSDRNDARGIAHMSVAAEHTKVCDQLGKSRGPERVNCLTALDALYTVHQQAILADSSEI